MIIVGLGSPFGHDPSAALLVDGEVIAATEEERFVRQKHAPGLLPIQALRFCLEKAGLRPEAVTHVAFPWSRQAYNRCRWGTIRRTLSRPDYVARVLFRGGKSERMMRDHVQKTLREVGIDPRKVSLHFVEHHLAHAASAYHLSGFQESAIMTVDAAGEFTSTLFGEGKGGKILVRKEIVVPDSLGVFYTVMTDYLGFERDDGEYKVMGMAPYGDPARCDLSRYIRWDRETFRLNEQHFRPPRTRRYQPDRWFSKEMVEHLGPPRNGDSLDEPYIHVAAASQRTLEEVTLTLLESYLSDALKKYEGHLCFAGGCALNVSLNRRLIEHPLVKRLFVQPAANDAGAPLGAATYVAAELGQKIKPMGHVYLGPSYSNEEIREHLRDREIKTTYHDNIEEVSATLLSQGKILAWFQGAMEFGPRALGNRSILAHPAIKGIADDINERIKYRERWRPFCPSLLPEYAEEILGVDHPSPYMTFSFKVRESWKNKIPEVVHVDGTLRPQIVDPRTNPRFYTLLKKFHEKTDLPVLLNTSLNRRGEPMVCSPQDATTLFYGSGLEYLVMGNYLIKK
ncbi:MAG: carbamoyltransferase [Candidatus Omnitrophica bacterium]|nr:carbamoyltransferase [Candidatus Omnitrophota bacterium]